jgi:DNA-cytosine methyltransferase
MVGINVLSVFDGNSGAMVALERGGIKVNQYFSSEVDKYSMKVSDDNFGDKVIRLGNVNGWEDWDLPKIDLLIAGFPCQSHSVAGNRMGLEDVRGQLLYPLLKIIKRHKPKKLLLENVKGLVSSNKGKTLEFIMSELKSYGYNVGYKVMNSSLVSAQSRDRIYITNWDYPEPEDKGFILQDILESGYVDREKSYCLDANYWKGGNPFNYFEKSRRQLVFDRPMMIGKANGIKGHDILKRVYSQFGKSPTLTAHTGGNQEPKVDINEINWRKLTPSECELLQTLPLGFTKSVSNSRRYAMIGNGFTIDMIVHILNYSGLV